MRKFLFAAAFFPLLAIAQQDDSVFIRSIANEIMVNGQGYENLRYLTKQIGGRLAGSPQMVKAEQWGLATLKASGADTAYLQECQVPHWVRGGRDEAFIIDMDGQKQHRSLDALALGNSMGSGKKRGYSNRACSIIFR